MANGIDYLWIDECEFTLSIEQFTICGLLKCDITTKMNDISTWIVKNEFKLSMDS